MPVNLDMTNSEYHALPHLSSSGAKTIALQSLADFKYGERKETLPCLLAPRRTLSCSSRKADEIGRAGRAGEQRIWESADAEGATS